MSDATNERKLRHIHAILTDSQTDRRKGYFDAFALKHRALPELDMADVDPSIEFMGKRLSFPLLISSMTGGDHELVRTVNRNLATAAEATGVAMALGSQRVMLEKPEARSSFEVRAFAPSILLLANLGAVQLNYGFGIDSCREAVAAVGADGLCLHLNPLQEAIQVDGNTNFAGLAGKLAGVVEHLGKPVVLKEVGSGFSEEDFRLIAGSGIRYIDVAGSGGTSWSRIEQHNRPVADSLGLAFQDWGLPTPLALIALKPYRNDVTLIASGGIRSGIDMVKAMILGGSLCGVAAPFLEPAMESAEKVIGKIEQFKKEFVTASFLLGARKAAELTGAESLLAGNPGNWSQR